MSMGGLGMIGSKDALHQFALDTGGDAIVGTNDFGGALARVARDSSAYYLLAYESPHPDDGKFHNVSVKVKRPRLTVRARSGHLAFKQDERTAEAAAPASPAPVEVTSALNRLVESLRPNADEPSESRRRLLPPETPAAVDFLGSPTSHSPRDGRLARR